MRLNKTLSLAGIFALVATAAWANLLDNSANKPSFPPGGLTLLKTVVAQAGGTRKSISVQNQDSNDIQVWRDLDCAGTQLSVIYLATGGGVGKQGGSWSSDTFKGCLRVYGTGSSAQVGIWQD
jgi:hypothetical protein